MAIWVKDLNKDNFKVCFRETKILDGLHKDGKGIILISYLLSLSSHHISLFSERMIGCNTHD